MLVTCLCMQINLQRVKMAAFGTDACFWVVHPVDYALFSAVPDGY